MTVPKWRESSLNHYTCSLDNSPCFCDMSIRFDGTKYSCWVMSFYTQMGSELSIDEVKTKVVEIAIDRAKDQLERLQALLESMRKTEPA